MADNTTIFKNAGKIDGEDLIGTMQSLQKDLSASIANVTAGDPATMLRVNMVMQHYEMASGYIASIFKSVSDLFDRIVQKL